ncbi:MGMT family protein [Kosmotoga arenicorallina]|uniref:MGMT family protein n=1 Tax=Kosmotoga arenicorallina TaxID=688066 RepID=UPI000A795B7C|nr:MGMT family protein [Kosmotoga arenicorallina]
MKGLHEKIYETVKQIPFGKVASYGQIANIVGCTPRMVGFALASLKNNKVPWHRVINSKGTISLKEFEAMETQRLFLEREGVEFNKNGKVDFKKFGWNGDS